mmetsp:Transcript_52498/g.166966  ORF Transcript_52498/g.166966 Transcript_52498/m.166966 type:complete len:298 (-) Transcript_52498:90-983(-)
MQSLAATCGSPRCSPDSRPRDGHPRDALGLSDTPLRSARQRATRKPRLPLSHLLRGEAVGGGRLGGLPPDLLHLAGIQPEGESARDVLHVLRALGARDGNHVALRHEPGEGHLHGAVPPLLLPQDPQHVQQRGHLLQEGAGVHQPPRPLGRVRRAVLAGQEARPDGRVCDDADPQLPARLEHAVGLGLAVEDGVLDLVARQRDAAGRQRGVGLARAGLGVVGHARRLGEALLHDVPEAVHVRAVPPHPREVDLVEVAAGSLQLGEGLLARLHHVLPPLRRPPAVTRCSTTLVVRFGF